MTLSSQAERLVEPDKATDHYKIDRNHLLSAGGCHFDYRLFEPSSPVADGTLVVIGHGFLRHQNTLINLARKLANRGYRTATLNFCNMKPWNGHHRENAADMQLLADHLDGARRIYAGHSAGALAALVAAAKDPKSIGLITLDLVDQDGIGKQALASTSLPIVALHGAPSSCNANSRAVAMLLETSTASVTAINDANHCAFESPTNWVCTWFCGGEDVTASRREIQDRVVDAVETLAVIETPVDTSITHN